MKRDWLFTIALLLIAGMATLVACKGKEQEAVLIPIPPWIKSYEYSEVRPGWFQLDFVDDVFYPIASSRDFYARWARENGWELIRPEEEQWSGDAWHSFLQADRKIDQRLVHWASPGRKQSLRVVLRHDGNRSQQHVFVSLTAFQLLDNRILNAKEFLEEAKSEGREVIEVVPQ